MYALSRRRDLPLFSSLFRAKIRTRILSSPFECIRAPDRHRVNHMGRVNFQHITKYSLRNFVSPTPRGIRRPLSHSHFSCVPLLPHPFRTGIGAAKALPSFLPLAPSRHNAIGSLFVFPRWHHSSLDSNRASTKTPPSSLKKENSGEFKSNFV